MQILQMKEHRRLKLPTNDLSPDAQIPANNTGNMKKNQQHKVSNCTIMETNNC
jgi:hypothetical protein